MTSSLLEFQHLEFLVTKSNGRLFLMQKLKTQGLYATGLQNLHETIIFA